MHRIKNNKMLSRRYLRTKTLQALFEYEIGNSVTPSIGEKNLFTAIRNLKQLSLLQLEILLQLKKIAVERIENAKNKFLPSAEELDPNLKFINIALFRLIEENETFQKEISASKIDISSENDINKLIFQNIISSKLYLDFMSEEENDFEREREFVINLFKDFVVNNDALSSAFAEKNLHWASDFFEAALLTAKNLKMIKDDFKSTDVLPAFEINPEDEIDDANFVKTIYHSVINNKQEYLDIIITRLENWDSDRLANIDLIIMKMAIAEFLECPSVPIKVTINEYIELSKDYSTPKSKIFINGLLDKISIELRNQDKIKKTGRGLLS